MAQTAAHLADHVIPPVPVRQWVISVPKRLRGFLADRPAALKQARGVCAPNHKLRRAVTDLDKRECRQSGAILRRAGMRATTTPRTARDRTSTACDPCRTQGTEAPGPADWETVCAEARTSPSQEVSGVLGNLLQTPRPLTPRLKSRSAAGRPLPKCPLTGLFFLELGRHACRQ